MVTKLLEPPSVTHGKLFFLMGMEASVVYWRFDYIIYVYNFQEIAQIMGVAVSFYGGR